MKIIFVCLGNICRSPMAEGVMQSLVDHAGLHDQITVDSCGTGAWHVGDKAHAGTRAILDSHDIAYDGRARQISAADMTAPNTWIIAMDDSNIRDIKRRFGDHPHLHRLLDFSPRYAAVADVPDPYYSGGFDYVYELVADGCAGLLAHIRVTNDE